MSSNNNSTLSERDIDKRLSLVIDKIINDLLHAAETAPPAEAEQLIQRAKKLRLGGSLIQGMQSLSSSNVALNSARIGYSFNPIYVSNEKWTENAYSAHNSFAFYRMIKSMQQIMDPKSPDADRIKNIFATSITTPTEAQQLHDTSSLEADKKTQQRALASLQVQNTQVTTKLTQANARITELNNQKNAMSNDVDKSEISAKIEAAEAVLIPLNEEKAQIELQVSEINAIIVEIDQIIAQEREKLSEKITTLMESDNHRKKISSNHYAIISVIIEAHNYLSRLYNQENDAEIGRFKHELERIAYIYNLHNPALCIGIEHHQLSDLRIIKGTFETINNYFSKKRAKAELDRRMMEKIAQQQAQEQHQASNDSTPVGSVAPQPSLPPSPPSVIDQMLSEGQVEELRVNLTKSYDQGNIIKWIDKDADKKDKAISKSHSNKKVMQINAITTVQNEIGINSAIIDSSDLQDTTKVFNDFADAISMLIAQGLTLIALAMEYCNSRRYNIFLNEFDSIAKLDSNVFYMEAVGMKLAQYLNADMIANAEILPPRLFTREAYEKTCFFGQTGLGRELYSLTLPIGAKVSLRQKTTVTSTTESEKTKSVADTVNSKTTKSLGNSTQQEARDQNSVGKEEQKYTDHSLEAGAEVNTPAVSAGVNYGLNTGSSEQVRSTRETANNVMNNSFKNEVSEKSAQTQSTVTETTKEKMTETKEDGMMTEYENPNRLSPLEYTIYSKLQEVIAFNVLTNIHVLVENGIDSNIYNVSQAQFIMNRYLSEDAIKNAQDRIMEHCEVLDYKERRLKLYDVDEKGYLYRVGSNYLDILQKNKKSLDYEDMLYSGIYAGINGIITSKQVVSKETPGSGIQARVSSSVAADTDLLQRIHDEAALRQANIAMVQANVKSVINSAEKTNAETQRINIENKLLEKALIKLDTIEGTQAIQSVFYLTHDNKQLIDRTFVGQMLPIKKEKDEDGDITI